MPRSAEARDWAWAKLRGIGDSLYTPFSGVDGDDIDWDAYRFLVRHCVGALGHPMLWVGSGVAEFWSLTLDERMQLLEVAIEEGRAVNPDLVVQACTAALSAKDCLVLTRHAQDAGADIAYIQTPMMETHSGEGVLRFFKYISDRTDLALGMFNSPSSGYVLTAQESAAIFDAIPAVCATKEGAFRPHNSRRLRELAPGLVIWECDDTVYRAGWLRNGTVSPVQLGTASYLLETPARPMFSQYWDLVCSDQLDEAIEYARTSGLDELQSKISPWFICYPGRPDYFTHWGAAFKYAASQLGLPIGDYPHSRPPQGELPEIARSEIRSAYEKQGMLALGA